MPTPSQLSLPATQTAVTTTALAGFSEEIAASDARAKMFGAYLVEQGVLI